MINDYEVKKELGYMKNRLVIIIMLFIMVLVFILKCGQPIEYIVENGGVIEWHAYSEEKLV